MSNKKNYILIIIKLGIVAIFLSIGFATINHFQYKPAPVNFGNQKVEVCFKSPDQDEICQIYYDSGNGWNENEQFGDVIKKGIGLDVMTVQLPNKNIRSLRIDPNGTTNPMFIKYITIGQRTYQADEIVNQFVPLSFIGDYYEKDGYVYIKPSGIDSQLYFDGSSTVENQKLRTANFKVTETLKLVIFILAIILYYLLDTTFDNRLRKLVS